MAVAYRNRNTDQVVALPEADSRLEMLKEWERVDDSEISYAVADAHDRANAERASIEAAAALRMDSAAGSAIAGVAAAAAYNTGQAAGEGDTPGALPTLSTGAAGEQQQPVSLLDKVDPLRDTNATPFDINKAEADKEIENPPTEGVLKRAKRDHKKGRTQIGPNPEEHAGPRAAASGSDIPAGADNTENGGTGEEPTTTGRTTENTATAE